MLGFSLCILFLVKENSREIHGQSIIYFPYLKSRFFENLEKCVKVLIFFFEAVWPNESFFGHESIILDADASQCLKKVSERAILIFMCLDRHLHKIFTKLSSCDSIQFEECLMILGSVLEWLFCQAQELFASYFIPLIPVSSQLLAMYFHQ